MQSTRASAAACGAVLGNRKQVVRSCADRTSADCYPRDVIARRLNREHDAFGRRVRRCTRQVARACRRVRSCAAVINRYNQGPCGIKQRQSPIERCVVAQRVGSRARNTTSPAVALKQNMSTSPADPAMPLKKLFVAELAVGNRVVRLALSSSRRTAKSSARRLHN